MEEIQWLVMLKDSTTCSPRWWGGRLRDVRKTLQQKRFCGGFVKAHFRQRLSQLGRLKRSITCIYIYIYTYIVTICTYINRMSIYLYMYILTSYLHICVYIINIGKTHFNHLKRWRIHHDLHLRRSQQLHRGGSRQPRGDVGTVAARGAAGLRHEPTGDGLGKPKDGADRDREIDTQTHE